MSYPVTITNKSKVAATFSNKLASNKTISMPKSMKNIKFAIVLNWRLSSHKDCYEILWANLHSLISDECVGAF